MLRRILLVGAGGALIVFLLFSHYLSQGYAIETARSVAVTAMVMIEAFYLLNCRFLYESIFHWRIFQHSRPVVLAITAVILIQLGFCYLPFMQALFQVTAIGLQDWLLIVACASGIVVVVELEKFLVERLGRRLIKAHPTPRTPC
jgi:magnesium-transporting ATPase (P-type)